ncbi:MAG: TA system VapC family ribonuclease toxin [Spirochaetia bacterium]
MYLLDINIWLALTFDAHEHHHHAGIWFDTNAEKGCAFCRLTQMGFLRIATNRGIFGEDTLTLQDAWYYSEMLLNDYRIDFYNEPVGTEHFWKLFTSGKEYSPKVWNDAYLAAFTRAGDFHLVSFDRGFHKYSDLKMTILNCS